MCGISGIFYFRGHDQAGNKVVSRMLDKIQHRGPDGRKIFSLDRVVLGFVRLSFLDLEGGMQPILNEDGTVALVCNGEIFNYADLRKDLKARGHIFRTKTDVEVILHGYEEYGTDFFQKLNGQFAFAIYNSRNKMLLLVRDHLGIAPLFYTVRDGKLIFASEIKAILEYPGIERKLNLEAVDQALHFPGIVSPATFFRGIYSLNAGRMLTADLEGMKEEEYWDLEFSCEEDKGEDYYIENLRELLRESIRLRLIADVPIGFYISGGLDSSMVACYIDRYLGGEHDSFSAEVDAENFGEEKYQKIIQEHISSRHHSVRITEADLWERMQEVVYYTETALRESYDVAAYLLSELVQESPVRAILTGQGADELFNGYVGYCSDFFRHMQRGKMDRQECEINERLWGDPYFRYEKDHYQAAKRNLKIYSLDVACEWENFSALRKSPVELSKMEGLGSQRRRSYLDIKLRLSDHLLADHGDRMFFAHSVEGRHPFLDLNLVRFVTAMPEKYKLRGVQEKYILKRAAEGIVPKEIIQRKKFPFSTPGMSEMLKRKHRLADVYLNTDVIRRQNIFDIDMVDQMKERYMQEGFHLAGAYELDVLQVILTTTMLCEIYQMSV
ncbi:MAG: asparagine synthase (glutamine-hydrolyzing) [Eubacterium sp.]|nr:asparagine synthase (glutamine-hydrolyzing) [Eubacterium sp.]